MIASYVGRAYECVLVDINTQSDFCDTCGAHPVANLDSLVPALRRMIAWTKRNRAPIVSSVESHRMWEVPANGQKTLCCVDGTPGQRKIDFTIFPCRVRIEVDNTLAIPIDLFSEWQQVIFRKRSGDLLANPKADRFLSYLPVTEFIVFGTAIEHDVKAITLGLLTRNKKVTIVTDACGYWDAGDADMAIRQMAAKGACVATVEDVLRRKLNRRHRYLVSGKRGHSDNGRRNGGNGQAAEES